ncbi:hypothetical protein ANCDUO_04583 [Ancylostoma duodenale]|uniref:Uncharacterized protein n=1 Tax=Ancylostoma duodenale TaxID=51022 RepID=A0A0C2H0N3_9BILA|nr:hypothetical protein ANCDUO_04583 [Ancylostoma duodenale]
MMNFEVSSTKRIFIVLFGYPLIGIIAEIWGFILLFGSV